MPTSATIRAAQASDANAITALLIASRQTFLPYAPLAHSEAEMQRWVRDDLLPTAKVFVTCVPNCEPQDAGAISGVLAVSDDGQHRWIDQLYIAPGFVNQGLGRSLLQHALAILPRPIRLYTFQANTAARRFYERHGFVVIELTDGAENEEKCPDVLYQL